MFSVGRLETGLDAGLQQDISVKSNAFKPQYTQSNVIV